MYIYMCTCRENDRERAHSRERELRIILFMYIFVCICIHISKNNNNMQTHVHTHANRHRPRLWFGHLYTHAHTSHSDQTHKTFSAHHHTPTLTLKDDHPQPSHTHTHTHNHTFTHAQTQTRTHTHIHTHNLSHSLSPCLPQCIITGGQEFPTPTFSGRGARKPCIGLKPCWSGVLDPGIVPAFSEQCPRCWLPSCPSFHASSAFWGAAGCALFSGAPPRSRFRKVWDRIAQRGEAFSTAFSREADAHSRNRRTLFREHMTSKVWTPPTNTISATWNENCRVAMRCSWWLLYIWSTGGMNSYSLPSMRACWIKILAMHR